MSEPRPQASNAHANAEAPKNMKRPFAKLAVGTSPKGEVAMTLGSG
jgi:hypothetical protein